MTENPETTNSAHAPHAQHLPEPEPIGGMPEPAPTQNLLTAQQHVLEAFQREQAESVGTTAQQQPLVYTEGSNSKSSLKKTVFLTLLCLFLFGGLFAFLLWIGARAIRGDVSRSTPSPTPQVQVAKTTPTPFATAAPPTPVAAIVRPTPTPQATPKPTPTPTVTPRPTVTPTPTPLPSKIDLSVEGIQIEDPQTGGVIDAGNLRAGMPVQYRATVKNIGTQDSLVFKSNWVINGQTMGVNANGKLTAGRTAVYDDINSLVSPVVFIQTGTNTINYVVDAENVNKESATSNNTRSVTYNPQGTVSDVEAVDVIYYQQNTTTVVTTPTVGQALTARVKMKSNGADKLKNIYVRLRQNNNIVAETTYPGWITQGQTVDDALSYNFTASSGSTEFKIEVNPNNAFPETNTSNNMKTVTLSL